MTTIAKPSNRAFVLKSDKVDLFLGNSSGAEKALRRFHEHRPKDGVVTPLKKGKNV